MGCLLLEEKTCNLWQLQGSVGKLLGNQATDVRSHYQRLKRWLWSADHDKGLWIEMLRYQQQITWKGKSIEKLEKKARARMGHIVWHKFDLEEQSYTFVLLSTRTRSGKVELVRFITTLAPAKAVEYYGYRYRIESIATE